jgi:hypothetical protein
MTLFGAQVLTGGFTLTDAGEIPHRRVLWRGYAIDAPVALNFIERHDVTRPAPPKRDSYGRLIYMLPLGAEVVP